MSTRSETPRPRRSKAKLTEQALASRLAATLDPKIVAAAAETPAASPPVPKRVAAEPLPLPEAPVAASPAAAGAPGTFFGAGVDRITGAVSEVQALARDTAQSLADTRLKAAHSVMAFQKKLLEMVHANLNEGFAAAQKIVAAPSVGEAIEVQSRFAAAGVKTLADQAAELRSLSSALAQEARKPWAAQMAKSLERMKTGLSA